MSVAVGAELEREVRSPAVVHRDHVLAAGLGPADRLAGGARGPPDQDVLGRDALGAEAAADVGRDDAHVLGLEAEQPAQHHLVLVGRLRGDPQRQPPVLTELRGARPRLDRAGGEPLADDGAL